MTKQIVGILAFLGGLLIGGGAMVLSGQNQGVAGNEAGSADETAIEQLGGSVSDEDLAIAMIDGTTLYFSDFQALGRGLGLGEELLTEFETLTMLAPPLIDSWLIMRKAEQDGLTGTEAARAEAQMLRYGLLYNLYMDGLNASVGTDEQVELALASGEYDDLAEQQVKARHVLLESEAEAYAVISALDQGADFQELARTKSTGPSASQGGDLGWFAHQMMVTPFADAAFAMEPGTYTKQPVQSEFGFHVILVEGKRRNVEAARPQVQRTLVLNAYRSEADALRKQASIEMFVTTPDAPEQAVPAPPAAE